MPPHLSFVRLCSVAFEPSAGSFGTEQMARTDQKKQQRQQQQHTRIFIRKNYRNPCPPRLQPRVTCVRGLCVRDLMKIPEF